MDTRSRALRNQDLIVDIRQGQRAADDLLICEFGITPVIDMAELCLDALTSPMREMIGIDMRLAAKETRNARALLVRAEQLRASLREQVSEDPSLAPIVEAAEHGLGRAEDNIIILRDYAEGMSGWQPLALTVKRYLDTLRRRTSTLVRRANRARVDLAEENIGLIRGVAYAACRRDRKRFDEMISVANTQFIICMDQTYNPAAKSGVLFTTYATNCMKKRCLGAMATPQAAARIPHGRHALALRVITGKVPIDACDIVDPEERREEAGVRKRLYDLFHSASIDAKVTVDSDTTLGDLHLAAMDDEVNRIIDEIAVREIIDKALRASGLAHRIVVNEKLDVRGGNGPNTFEEIARILHREGLTEDEVTRQRIGQIWTEAKERIGRHMSKERCR